MENDKSAKRGARTHHQRPGSEEVLSPQEAADLYRGQALKRTVRAAAALRDLYDNAAIAHAVGVSSVAVTNWWKGARPSQETLYRLADVTGLSAEELSRFLYADGPTPSLPVDPVRLSELEKWADEQAASRSPRPDHRATSRGR